MTRQLAICRKLVLAAAINVGYAAVAQAQPSGQGPETHSFVKPVRLKPGVSLTVTRRSTIEFQQRYPSEFADSAHNLVAFEFALRTADEAEIVFFKTDRENPVRSDVVVLCDSARINISKMGSAPSNNPTAYNFGPPGAYQASVDSLWHSMTIGSKTFLVFFELPTTCTSSRHELLVGLRIKVQDKESTVWLRFVE